MSPPLVVVHHDADVLAKLVADVKRHAPDHIAVTGDIANIALPAEFTRGRDWQSLNVKGLYPAGEGAGYAGGIMSAGVDGIEVAEAVGRSMLGIAPADSGSAATRTTTFTGA